MASEQEVLDSLDRSVFDPILRASPRVYSDVDRRKLHSSAAHRMFREVAELGLPRLPDVKDEC